MSAIGRENQARFVNPTILDPFCLIIFTIFTITIQIDRLNQIDPDQMMQNAVSDQDIH